MNDMISREEMLSILSGIVQGFGKILGPETEIVLHDFAKKEIVSIANGQVTGRQKGYRLPPAAFQTIRDMSDADGHFIGYGSKTKLGKQLRSSHIIVSNSSGEPQALICINQDMSRLISLRNELDRIIDTHSPAGDSAPPDPGDANYIQKVTRQVILDAIERMKPSDLSTKEAKMKIIRLLDVKNVFDVKDAVPQVCKLLSISQATLYNYLRDIRTEKGRPHEEAIVIPSFLAQK